MRLSRLLVAREFLERVLVGGPFAVIVIPLDPIRHLVGAFLLLAIFLALFQTNERLKHFALHFRRVDDIIEGKGRFSHSNEYSPEIKDDADQITAFIVNAEYVAQRRRLFLLVAERFFEHIDDEFGSDDV